VRQLVIKVLKVTSYFVLVFSYPKFLVTCHTSVNKYFANYVN